MLVKLQVKIGSNVVVNALPLVLSESEVENNESRKFGTLSLTHYNDLALVQGNDSRICELHIEFIWEPDEFPSGSGIRKIWNVHPFN